MENAIKKEISISNIYELSTIIKDTLIQCMDTQIFISNTLFKRLFVENKNSIIWEEAVLNGVQYCDKVEKAFICVINDNNTTKAMQMNFVSNCLEYMHLTYFASKGILYRHYLKGMKIILIINTD